MHKNAMYTSSYVNCYKQKGLNTKRDYKDDQRKPREERAQPYQ